MNIPKWFTEWKENDYEHLKDDVSGIRRDLNQWIKPLLLLILAAIIATAISILVTS